MRTNVIEFKTKEEYDDWLQKNDNIKVISVNTNKRWSFWTGFLGDTKTYTVTYEEASMNKYKINNKSKINKKSAETHEFEINKVETQETKRTADEELDFSNPFSSKETIVYKNKNTGEVKQVKTGFCWPCLFFGYFWYLFKGMWSQFFVTWAVALVIFFLSSPAYYLQWLWFGYCAVNARREYANHLIKKGYEKIDVIKK